MNRIKAVAQADGTGGHIMAAFSSEEFHHLVYIG